RLLGAGEQLGELRVMVFAPILPHRVVHICPVQLVLEREPSFFHATDAAIEHLERDPLDAAAVESQQSPELAGCHRLSRDREYLQDVLHVRRTTLEQTSTI